MKTTILSSTGRVVIPPTTRRQLKLKTGDQFEVLTDGEEGTLILRHLTRRPNEGLAKHLFACPHKNWFRAPLRSKETLRKAKL